MSNEEIKLYMLREHARDKKLTFISYSLILVLAILILVFLGGFLMNMFLSEEALYPKLAIGAALIGYLIYAIVKISKLTKRSKEIEELLLNIESGSRCTNKTHYKEYKMTIPLGKVTYKMFPVQFYKLALDSNPMKFYTLPIHPAWEADFNTLLSGVSLEAINEKIEDIYRDDTEVEYNDEAVPKKTAEEFRQFLSEELGDTVNLIEDSRKSSRKTTLLWGGISILVVIGFLAYMYTNVFTGGFQDGGFSVYLPIIIVFALFYIVYYVFIRPRQMKTAAAAGEGGGIRNSAEFDFKTKIMGRIVEFISPKSEYVMHGHIGLGEVMASGLFVDSNYKVMGNDLIIGRYRGVPYQFCDLSLEVQKKVTQENEGPEYAFSGQFFVARFNKTFSSPVFIVPKTGLKKMFTNTGKSGYIQPSGQKIELEDPEFMDMFTVYGQDQIEARYILTPSLMERIKELAKRRDGKFHISFYENRITVADNSGKNNFEFKQSKSITDNNYKVMVDFFEQMQDQFSIIDDLKLNIKIWR